MLLSLATVAATIVGVQSPAFAYPISTFHILAPGKGEATGSVTWYNRSVEIQGSLINRSTALPEKPVTATFTFYLSAARVGERPEEPGGASSTPTTPSFAQPDSRRQGAPWLSPPAVI